MLPTHRVVVTDDAHGRKHAAARAAATCHIDGVRQISYSPKTTAGRSHPQTPRKKLYESEGSASRDGPVFVRGLIGPATHVLELGPAEHLGVAVKVCRDGLAGVTQ